MNTKKNLMRVISILGLCFSGLALGESGTYEVPVTDPALVAVSFNDVNGISARINGRGEIRVDYHLPIDIAGNPPVRNRLRGIVDGNGEAQVTGTYSDGTCYVTKSTGDVECRLHMNERFKEYMDPEVIAEQLNTRYADNVGLAAKKIAVMRTFGFDAIGVLRFRLDGTVQ